MERDLEALCRDRHLLVSVSQKVTASKAAAHSDSVLWGGW
jgi:hypothetical protein